MDISNSGHGTLEIVPSIFNENLECLTIGNNTKVSVEACKLIKNAKNLKSLEFAYSQVEGVIDLDGLNALETLRFSHENDIKCLKENLQSIYNNCSIKCLEIGDSTYNEENVAYIDTDHLENINNMSSLKDLTINGTEIEGLHEDVLKLSGLERLEIQTNSFNETVCKMSWLKELVIKGSYQNPVTSDISNLENLEILDLGYAKNLPEEISELKNLKRLTFVGQMKSLPASFKNLDSLVELDITSTDIDVNDLEYIGELKNLERLDCCSINGGKLKEFPTFIRTLKTLKILNVSMQKFEEIPEWLVELQNLEALDISYTNIKELPDFFTKFSKLKELNLNYTQKLKSITASIGEIKSLTILHKDLVKTKKIMMAIESCKNLEQLYLSHFSFKEYPNFELMENLKVLDIRSDLYYRFKGEELQEEVNKIKLPSSLEHLVIEKEVVELMPEDIQNIFTNGPVSCYSKSVFQKRS